MIKKEGETMDRDTIFLYVIAVIALCFGLINCIQIFFKGNKTAETVTISRAEYEELLRIKDAYERMNK